MLMMESDIQRHYNSDHLTETIKAALLSAGKDLALLEPRDLAPVDQLHTGGAMASLNLFKKIHWSPDHQVLDAGCGIGGSARLMAGQFNCRVEGVDLAGQFIDTARFLTQCTRLESQVSFQQGSVLELPFADRSFDTILCQHILMNIKDKAAAIREFSRVLKKDGTLILHEIFRGDNDRLLLPVPWAGHAGISFLDPWEVIDRILSKHGFEKEFYSDESPAACLWWEKVKDFSRKKSTGKASLGPGLIFGDSARSFGNTMHGNFKNKSICLVEAILKKRYHG